MTEDSIVFFSFSQHDSPLASKRAFPFGVLGTGYNSDSHCLRYGSTTKQICTGTVFSEGKHYSKRTAFRRMDQIPFEAMGGVRNDYTPGHNDIEQFGGTSTP